MRREILAARLEEYLRAEDAILHGQSYTMGDVSLTRADLEKVQTMIARLDRALSIKVRSRMRVVVPVDGVNMYRCRRIIR